MGRIKAKHPHITENPNISQGSPVIKGTRTRIVDIIIEYEYLGKTPDEIVNAHPHLNLAQVHDAVSYYFDHRDQVDQEISQRKEKVKELRNQA